MDPPPDIIASLVEERRSWPAEAVAAELAAMEPLPPEEDPAWGDEHDAVWRRAELLAAHGELIAEHGWIASIPIALEKASPGDPSGRMTGLIARLAWSCPAGDLVAAYARALRVGSPGARWWAARELGRLADPITIPLLFAALADPVNRVGQAVCEALLRIAGDDPEVRVPLRESLAEIVARRAPLADDAAKALAALDALERAAQPDPTKTLSDA